MARNLALTRRPKVPAEDTAAFGAIAERFRRAGALEQAVSLCREGLQKFPDHVSARVTLGWSLLDLGKYDEARAELEQVMRRAPDNLAAIRGLAELHDRFEHTLNLPMDGPGQWPPPADEVEGEAEEPGHASALSALAEEYEDEGAGPTMAPAEMGLPLWTPEETEVASQAPVVETPAATPIAHASVTTAAPAPTPSSGMSSVREIDAFAGAPVPAAVSKAQPVVVDAPISLSDEVALDKDVDLGASDDAIAALLAEAESLDAAAELQTNGAVSPVEETEQFDLAEPVAFEVSEFEAPAAQPIELGTFAPAVQNPEPEVDLTPAFVAAEPEVEALAPVEVVAFETPAEVEVEPELLSEPVAEPVTVAIEDVAAAAVAEVFEPEESVVAIRQESAQVVAIAARSRNAAVIASLERMLVRVQTRRTELMAQSVA